MKRLVSMMMTLILALNMFPTAALAVETQVQTDQPEIVSQENAEETGAIHGDTRWSYLDDGTDPAADSADRTSWTEADYDDSAWQRASGQFGAKNGGLNTLSGNYTPTVLLSQYKDGTDTDKEAFFFRTQVTIQDASAVKAITGSLIYDDAAVVYLNGTKLVGFNDNLLTQAGGNMQYSGNGDTSDVGHTDAPATGAIEITDPAVLSLLKNGVNTIAVELHQDRSTSSDIYFEMPSLVFCTEEEVPEQSDLSLSVGADQSQMNFTWHCTTQDAGTLLIAENSAVTNGEMPENAVSYQTAPVSNNDGQYTNKAVATGLKAGTTYAYQVANGDVKSEIRTFTTDDGEAFSFAYVADPQIGASGNADSDTTGWDNTLNIIGTNQLFSGVSFLLSAGDQVNRASSEDEYDRYLDHEALSGLPVATVIGNHDSSSDAYKQHFNVANESDQYGASTLAGGDSWFVYNNVLFMVLNTNDLSAAEHKAFMEEAIAANPDVDWKVVSFHQSIYTVASHYNNDGTDRRETLTPVFDELDIDVVLQGHDHVYCRTYMMDGLNVSENEIYTYGNGENTAPIAVTDPKGILYVTANSGSGSKHYNIVTNVEFPYAAVQNQERIPNASRIDVTANSFTITTYRTTDLSVVDTFTINRTEEVPQKTLEGISVTTQPTKTSYKAGEIFDPTGMVVTATYSDGTTAEITDYTITPNGPLTTKDKIVTVTCEDKTASVDITVKKASSSHGTSTSYAVGLEDMENGSVDASSKSAVKGSTVTLTVTPDEGYELANLTVADKNGKELTLTQKGDGVYTFTMPASKVTVSAVFQEIEVPVSQLPFTDVAEKDWFYEGVSFVYEKGIMNGLTQTAFGPSVSTTRGMVVTMLWRMEDQPQAQSGAAFADVKEGAYYAQAIDWAAENGIVNGTSDTTFAPDQDVTRQQLAAILYRYSQYKGYDTTAQGDLTAFGDWAQVSDYAAEAMAWAVGSGLVQGMDNDLVPSGSATRAQLATIFTRFITNFVL